MAKRWCNCMSFASLGSRLERIAQHFVPAVVNNKRKKNLNNTESVCIMHLHNANEDFYPQHQLTYMDIFILVIHIH